MKNSNNRLRTPKRRKKNNATKVIIIVTIVVLLLAIAGVITFAVLSSKGGGVSTEIPFTPVTANGETAKEILREDKSYNFLIVGKDNVALNTDVMIICNVNMIDKSVTMMQMPRDTLVTLSDSVPRKLNSVFAIYYNSADCDVNDTEGRTRAGMEGLRTELSHNLAITIDHYAFINLDSLGAIVDSMGGVDITVPADMDYEDPAQDLYIHLKAGHQTLNGDQAQQFVRFRSGYIAADTARQDAQKIFLSAFLESFKEKVTLTALPSIVSTMSKQAIHTLTDDDCLYFAKCALNLDLNNATLLSAPSQGTTYNNLSYVVLNRGALYEVTNKYFNLFDTDIPEPSFDIDRNFTITNDATVNGIYTATMTFTGEHTASDVNANGIEIARKNY